MRGIRVALALTLLGAKAQGQVLTGDEAAQLLFSHKGHVVQVSSKLTALEKKIATGVVPLMASQLRQPVRYYAAIAYSPKDGMLHNSLQAAMNFHTPRAADKAAVAACNRLKSNSAPTCRVAARILPKRFKARDFTLSIDATVAFQRSYQTSAAPKSFAISPSSGDWGMGVSDRAALKVCQAKGRSGDCKIVIRDE